MTNKIKETHEFKKKHNVDVKICNGCDNTETICANAVGLPTKINTVS